MQPREKFESVGPHIFEVLQWGEESSRIPALRHKTHWPSLKSKCPSQLECIPRSQGTSFSQLHILQGGVF